MGSVLVVTILTIHLSQLTLHDRLLAEFEAFGGREFERVDFEIIRV